MQDRHLVDYVYLTHRRSRSTFGKYKSTNKIIGNKNTCLGGDSSSRGGSASSLSKQIISFIPKNKVKHAIDGTDTGRTNSPYFDSDLAIVDF